MERNKIQVRKESLQNRSFLTEEERRQKNHKILQAVIAGSEYMNADSILIYASYQSEVDTFSLMEHSFQSGKEVYAPKVIGSGNQMEFIKITSTKDLITGYKGIPEPRISEPIYPVEITEGRCLMILPGVAFDKTGNRIGYGKGFYDRYLSRSLSKDNIYKLAIAYECQIYDELPSDAFDIRMDKIITEKGEYQWN